jgi:hypothetical protein
VTVTSDRTLTPGVYESITVTDDATLTLGVYVLTELPGLAVLENASVRGTAVTLYLACTTYPTPCDALGAGLSLTADASYAATAPTDGPYAHIALFSDRDNLTPSSSPPPPPPPPPAPSTPRTPASSSPRAATPWSSAAS